MKNSDIIKDCQTISRRDFFKLKLLLMIYLFFNRVASVSKESTKIVYTDYSLLDRFLELPFSKDIKKEIAFRASLQKKYYCDASGKPHSLKRFVRESTNFIAFKKSSYDIKVLFSLKDSQMDIGYLLNCVAKHNDPKSIRYIQKKLLNINSFLLNDALIYAIKSRSIESTIYLLKQNTKISNKTKETLQQIISQEDYYDFKKRLTKLSDKHILPSVKKHIFSNKKKKKILARRFIDYSYNLYDTNKQQEALLNIVYNSLVDLIKPNIIDDFSLNLSSGKIKTKVWRFDGRYPLEFLSLFEKTLRLNGFEEYKQYYLASFETEMDAVLKPYKFPIKSVDCYGIIEMEVL
jgi:hypothetical protein